ncbi:MAG: hypothetical protein ACXVAX_01565, partial [Pseudobdellovibrio sp.]
LPGKNEIYLWMLALVSIFDSGHVYITLWRTWWNTGLAEKPRAFYFVPAGVFLSVLIWNYFSFPYLWTFVVYYTVYHNVRQLYGINKWYQLIENRFDKASDYFLYGVCGLSFLALHFKPDFHYAYYTGHDLLVYPHAFLFSVCKAAVLFLVVLYLIYEASLYRRNKKIFLNRFYFILSAMAVYMASCLWADNELQLLAPLILTHAFHYLALTVLTGAKTNTLLKLNSYFKVTLLVLSSLLIFGAFEFYTENNYLDFFSHTLVGSLLIAIYLVPLLTHFILDAMIWKRNYPEFRDFLRDEFTGSNI